MRWAGQPGLRTASGSVRSMGGPEAAGPQNEIDPIATLAAILSRGRQMKRRELITLVGGAAAVWPLATQAQQSGMPVVGVLCGTRFDQGELAAVRKGLAETGYVEGSNVLIEYRSAEGNYDRLRRSLLSLPIAALHSSLQSAARCRPLPPRSQHRPYPSFRFPPSVACASMLWLVP